MDDSKRFFHTNIGWFIYLREGDEHHQLFNGCKPMTYYVEDGRPIAGPFRTKNAARYWLRGFTSLYGKARCTEKDYIPDILLQLNPRL